MAFTDELQQMLDDCHTHFGRSVTLNQVQAGAFTAATMERQTTTTPISCTAIRDQRQMSPGSGKAMTNEAMYAVRASQLPAGVEPIPGWELVDAGAPGGSETWRVARVQRSADGLAYELFCRDLRKS